MRWLLLLMCSGCCLGAMAQKDSLPAEYWLGRWKAIGSPQPSKAEFLILFGKDRLELRYDSVSFQSRYKIECARDSCILTLLDEKGSGNQFVLIKIDQNAFFFNPKEQQDRYMKERSAKPGAIAWGWSDSRPIRFVRQQPLP